MLKYKDNTKELIATLVKKDQIFRDSLKQAMYSGGLQFAGDIKRNQMTGRPGVKVGTTTLRERTAPDRPVVSGGNISVKVHVGAWYGIVHQLGAWIFPKPGKFLAWKQTSTQQMTSKGTGKNYLKYFHNWIYTKRPVFIPKRLHIYEYFNSDGSKIWISRINEAIKKLCTKGAS